MLTSILLSFLSFMPMQIEEPPQPSSNVPDRIEVEIQETRSLDYLIAMPSNYDAEGEAVPLILFLHGAGERGNDLEKLKTWGPPKMVEAGHDFGAIVVSPQCPASSWWTNELDLLVALLDKIEGQYNIDKSRIYVTGISMGGYGTFALAAKQPERFAAIIPICGGGTYFDAMRLSQIPMWVFHGDIDDAVPLDESVRMVRFANSRGGRNAKLTVFPDTGHISWPYAYGDEKVWQWLFAQKKP